MQRKNKKQPKTAKQERDQAYAKRERKGIVGPIQNMGMAMGTVGGAYVGGPLGAGIGATLGSAVGKAIGYVTGSGDYHVNGGTSVPTFSKDESTIISHREYVMDVTSGLGTPSAFKITKLALNPGDPATFPWLAAIAANYEEYEFLGCIFQYKSTSGDAIASTNTTLGTVILATQYDPTKPAFDTKQEMQNYFFSQSCKPADDAMHAIELKKSITPVKQLYVRNGKNTSDLRWTDFGNFYIATVGMQAAGVNLGELWVTYKVKLLKPKLPQTVGLGGAIASSTLSGVGATTANPFGAGKSTPLGPLDLIVTNNTVRWKVNPDSIYIAIVNWYSTGTVTPGFFGSLVNVIPSARLGGNTNNYLGATVTNAQSQVVYCVESTVTGGGDQYAQMTANATVTVSGEWSVIITQVDDTFGVTA